MVVGDPPLSVTMRVNLPTGDAPGSPGVIVVSKKTHAPAQEVLFAHRLP